MVKIKQLHLKNYCGYRDTLFDFTNNGGSIKPLSVFFGPNGCGKSTCLQAVLMLTASWQYEGRKTDLLFRKLVFNKNYHQILSGYKTEKKTMEITGIFDTNQGEKTVVINSKGFVKNELARRLFEYAYYVDSDNPLNMSRFQINVESKELFIDMAKAVYGLDCYLSDKVYEPNKETGKDIEFYTNFTIYKDYEDVKVHFRNMSAGERKIATMLKMLCNPSHLDEFDIFLIDNVVMHVYFKRHKSLINKLIEHFSKKQILSTTHSAVLIGHDNQNGYLSSDVLYDVEYYKRLSVQTV